MSDLIRGRPEYAVPYNGQSYAELQEQLLQDGELFEDPDFPATDASLYFSQEPPKPVEWKRPSEITENPYGAHLYVGGASRFDIVQGDYLGDCWLLAALASLCQNKGLLNQVVPIGQSFETEGGYCGMFRFRFWRYGRWVEVLVDDRLPTYDNKLIFLSSAQGDEFWSALLEKAYAKLHGSYEALEGGNTSEAMEDFTGGLTERTMIPDIIAEGYTAVGNFFKMLLKAHERQSLMCCSIESDEIEAPCDNGLVKGHAYTLTGVKIVEMKHEKLAGTVAELVRVRNPWGNSREWNGAWSDGSASWYLLTDEQKEEIGLTYDDDGEFWMYFSDFMENFTKVEICMLSPDSAGDSEAKRWEMQVNEASWQEDVSAGGCSNYPETFHTNPQFRITLEDPDDDEDVDNCSVVIAIMQKNRRLQRILGKEKLLIGFRIYLVEDGADGKLGAEFFQYNAPTARSGNFIGTRSVTNRFSLPPGDYCVIPSTFDAGEVGDFIIRMFSEKAQSMRLC